MNKQTTKKEIRSLREQIRDIENAEMVFMNENINYEKSAINIVQSSVLHILLKSKILSN